MLVCSFTGHREIFDMTLSEKLYTSIAELLTSDSDFVFYTGEMGEFDSLCLKTVCRVKREHPLIKIRLCLVLP